MKLKLEIDNEEFQVLRNALISSGFPFQTAVSSIVKSTPRWNVVKEEYPWLNENGDSHFLDIIASNGQFYLGIECKKTQKEKLVFLSPVGKSEGPDCNDVFCLQPERIQDSTGRIEIFNKDYIMSPLSFEAMLCVLSTDSAGKESRLLERDARLVVQALNAFALEFKKTKDPRQLQLDVLFIPVIVTNAPLYVATYNPQGISLVSGQLECKPENIEQVPWVRFKKSFGLEEQVNLGDRTVMVINSQEISKYLKVLNETQPKFTGQMHICLPGRKRL